MWSHRRSRRRENGIDEALRSLRSEPRQDFVRTLAGHVHASRPRARHAWSRAAFAGAASTLLLGVFASFGGLTYTASGASSTYHAVKKVLVTQKVAVKVHKSSAADEYPPPPKTPSSPAKQVAGASANEGAAGVAAAAQSKTLPFTGFPLLGAVIVSIILIAVGLILRRRERQQS